MRHNRRYKYNYKVELPNINFLHILIVGGALIFLYFFISNSIVKYYLIKKQYDLLENKLKKLQEENNRLRSEIYFLQNDTATIEYYIRKKLGYKKPKEKVVIIK